MKLKHRFAKWLLKDKSDSNGGEVKAENGSIGYGSTSKYATSASSQPVTGNTLNSNNITLRVYPGLGGIAIESVKYDRQSGDSNVTLHVVPDNAELSDALAKIITLESIRGC